MFNFILERFLENSKKDRVIKIIINNIRISIYKECQQLVKSQKAQQVEGVM